MSISISPYLHLLSGAEALPIPACDGTIRIGVNSNQFIFSPDFYCIENNVAKPVGCVQVYDETVSPYTNYVCIFELLGGLE